MVKTFHYPRLIPQHLTGSEVPNWESSVSLRKEYILGIDDTPGRVRNWLAMTHTFG